MEPLQKYSESLFFQLDKALRKVSTLTDLKCPGACLCHPWHQASQAWHCLSSGAGQERIPQCFPAAEVCAALLEKRSSAGDEFAHRARTGRQDEYNAYINY